VRLVLDEMWAPAIAEQLRSRGHDAISAQEDDHRSRYAGITDELFFERAQDDERTVVTDNVADFLQLVADFEQAELAHHGVVICSSRQFDRADPRTVGRMVGALEALLRSDAAAETPFNRRHWLRRSG
jgi:hypothetical protein